MDTVELLTKFADPEVMKTLSISQRLAAGLITTVLGMGITFVSLVVLQFVIGLMARLSATKSEQVSVSKPVAASMAQTLPEQPDLMKDEEIVAAITTALAVQLKTSVNNIVIRNIEKIEESTSAWHKAGIAEQMNNSL